MGNIQIVRKALIKIVNESSNKSNDSLKNHIANIATDDEIMGFFLLPNKFLKESLEIDLEKIPPYILAGRSKEDKYNFLKGILKEQELKEAVNNFSSNNLMNQFYMQYKGLLANCNNMCKKTSINDKNGQSRTSVCNHQCRYRAALSIIHKIQMQKAMCRQSANPQACIQNLMTQETKYRQEMGKEVQELKKAKFLLFNRMRKVPSNMSIKPSSEKWRNND